MKNGKDIQKQFGAVTNTSGSNNVFSCKVFINNQLLCEGLGSTLETAEDTAYYGALISIK